MEEKETPSPRRLYDLNSRQTLETIQGLLDRGIDKMSVMIRHSDRHYHRDPMMEPFMGLTPEGKAYAFDMGMHFPAIEPRLFASHFGRCIETAYLIDKGYSRSRGAQLAHVETCDLLAPFYIKDIKRALGMMVETGSKAFIRSWFDHAIDPSVMENPETTADQLTAFMKERLDAMSKGQIAVCVSHDWNIFPIREFKLDLPHESAGDVGYLDGIVFYNEDGQTYALTYQAGPVAV